MTKPIKLPPLTVKMLMDVFGSHSDIPPALLCTSWKDGIDIDETSMRAQMLVEDYARLAVEQATTELRAEVDALKRRLGQHDACNGVMGESGYVPECISLRAEVERLREALSDLVALLPDPELDRDDVQRGYVLAARAALKEPK